MDYHEQPEARSHLCCAARAPLAFLRLLNRIGVRVTCMHACRFEMRSHILISANSHTTHAHDVTRKRRTILGVGAPMRKGQKEIKNWERKKG